MRFGMVSRFSLQFKQKNKTCWPNVPIDCKNRSEMVDIPHPAWFSRRIDRFCSRHPEMEPSISGVLKNKESHKTVRCLLHLFADNSLGLPICPAAAASFYAISGSDCDPHSAACSRTQSGGNPARRHLDFRHQPGFLHYRFCHIQRAGTVQPKNFCLSARTGKKIGLFLAKKSIHQDFFQAGIRILCRSTRTGMGSCYSESRAKVR
jgi:hypothetical protein